MTDTTVLLVEDDDGDAQIIGALFSDTDVGGPVHITRAESVARAVELMTDGLDPDCALVDLGLSGASGTQSIMAMVGLAPDLPIVVLTGSNDPELARAAIRAGAQDYLVKGAALDEEVARRAIRYSIERAAQIEALRSSRAELRDFAHRVAHDLKSPMSVIIGSLDLLGRTRREGEDTGIYDMLARSSTRLVEMVDRLVEYADAAGNDVVLTTVHLDDVLLWVIETLGGALDGVTVDVEYPLPDVDANEVALRHVFLNLVTNAVRHADPSRPPRVRIAVEPSADGATQTVTVTDNGRGIAPEHRASVFVPGYRIDDSEPGTGLGLATVRRTVQLVGGQVAVDAGPAGIGTTFRLDFRAATR